MIYPQHFEQKIGFDKIREMLVARCNTRGAAEMVAAMDFVTDYEALEQELTRTDEMRVICLLENSFPRGDYADSAEFLISLAIPSFFLDLPSLVILKQSLETVKAMLRFFSSTKEGSYPELKKLALPIIYYPIVIQRLDSILDKFGGMRDNASETLLEIRRSKREKEQQVTRRIQAILSSAQASGFAEEGAQVTVHDGRVLIPVPSANKKKIEGLVYEESASGKTSFIEPLEIVNLNNRIRELGFAEQREMQKILVQTSDFLRPYQEDLLQAARFLSRMDFIYAKASMGLSMKAGKPVLLPAPSIRLQKARHPLLEAALAKEKKEIVPLNMILSPEKRILLISGPNAGGKSVCLKTVGLIQYMLQCGLLVPCSESSEIGIFDSVFIDIGDEQSLENDLSTYSSHLQSMKTFLLNANGASLLLIDEFGSGTEPTAGGAIAEALLEQWEQKGCFGVITTHYSNLKFYATASSAVQNAAMQFDVQNIQPLFKLEMGVPGNSFAFELARKMGMPESIIATAQEKAGAGFVDMEKHLKTIARNRRRWEEKVAKIKQTDKALDFITDKYQTELGEIQRLRKQMLEDAKNQAKAIVEEANKKVENTIREIRESQAEKERTRIVRENLKEFKETLEADTSAQVEQDAQIQKKMEQLQRRKEKQQERRLEQSAKKGQEAAAQKSQAKVQPQKALQVGDKVKIKEGSLSAEILEIKGSRMRLAIGDLMAWTTEDKIERMSQNEYKAQSRPSKSSNLNAQMFNLGERRLAFSSNLDVRGMRLEEALETVSRFIDDALMLGVSNLRILHGKGNGVLREELRKYLKAVGPQLHFEDEHVERGGAGITVIHID